MKWFIKRNLCNYVSMTTLSYDLTHFDPGHMVRVMEIGEMRVTATRLFQISFETQKKLEEAITRMDCNPMFSIEEARRRLTKGDFFTIAETDKGDIVGWTWAARDEVDFSEFFAKIRLERNQAFSFNTYVEKSFRGYRVNHIMKNEQFRNLLAEGFTSIWSLVYPGNKASINSLIRHGWKDLGRYRFIKFMMLDFRLPPGGIPGGKTLLFS